MRASTMQLRTQQCQSPCSTTASQLPAPCTSHYRRHRHRQRSLYVCAVDKSGGSEVGVTEAQPTTTLQPPASPQATSSSFAEPPSQQSLEAVQLPMTVRTLKNGPPGLEGAVLRGADIFLRSLRRLKWQNLKPRALAINLLFVLGVILVNWGVESFLEYWLGDSVIGSIGCILFGAGVLTWFKVRQVSLSRSLFSAFWQ